MSQSDKLAPILPQERMAMEQILALTKNDFPKLPEPLFISHILPILCDASGKADVTAWLQVAGSLNRAIDVVDGAGNVLFRCPPLQRALPTRVARDGRPPIAEVSTQANLRRQQSPARGEAYFEQAMNARVPRTRLDLEPLLQLNAIFRRYNIPEIPIAKETELKHEAEKRGSEFTGEYDDL